MQGGSCSNLKIQKPDVTLYMHTSHKDERMKNENWVWNFFFPQLISKSAAGPKLRKSVKIFFLSIQIFLLLETGSIKLRFMLLKINAIISLNFEIKQSTN